MKEVKKYTFVKDYFSDVSILIDAIQKYNQKADKKNNEYPLLDLFK